MIDVENLVIDTVISGVQTVHTGLSVTQGFNEETATFPCVVIRETNNAPVQRMDTDDCAENYARLTYQVDIYSDKAGTARSECRKLLNLVDGIMQGMKFRRINMSEPLNVKRSIFRQYARYSVIVGKGVETITGNTVYQMYRR